MVQFIQGREITLAQLIDQFGLQRADNEQFFLEWQQDLPELSDLEKQSLNEVKAEYLHLSRYQILEPVVKMVVLSPLLRLAGFYQPPFYIASNCGIGRRAKKLPLSEGIAIWSSASSSARMAKL